MKNSTRLITQYAVYGALIFTARMLDHIVSGWLPINFALFTKIVAFSCALIIPTWKNCLAVGIIFGVMSLLTSLMFGGGAVIYGMVNPLISILPRAIVGLTLFVTYFAVCLIMSKMVKNERVNQFVAIAIASCLGAVVNTVTVLTMMFIFKSLAGIESVLVIFGINALVEWIGSPLLTPFVTLGVKRGLKNRLATFRPQTKSEGGEE